MERFSRFGCQVVLTTVTLSESGTAGGGDEAEAGGEGALTGTGSEDAELLGTDGMAPFSGTAAIAPATEADFAG